MPSWNQVLDEIENVKREGVMSLDTVRRKYLKKLSNYTKRPTIAYYSGWLTRGPNVPGAIINDEDKNAFMSVIHREDRRAGLDLILHTPGGDLAATESLVDYLRSMFGTNIRTIIPQLAMSAGTMIACSSKEIVMGKQSSLGPIDPQLGGVPAHGVICEFDRAIKEVKKDPGSIPIWQTIIGKYHPTFLGECSNSIIWAEKIVEEWLTTAMFAGDENSKDVAKRIVSALSDHDATLSHSRHISASECSALGLKITNMEDDEKLQDLVLTVHHSYMHTFGQVPNAIKIVENERGIAVVRFAGSP